METQKVGLGPRKWTHSILLALFLWQLICINNSNVNQHMKECTIPPARTQSNNLQNQENYKWSNKDRKTCPTSSKSKNYTWKGRPELRAQPAFFPQLHTQSVWPSWSFSHRTRLYSDDPECTYPASAVDSALQAAHNCLLDITWLSQGILNLAQSCCSPGHSCPIKWHHFYPGTQVKNPGAALVTSWHLNH